MYEIDLSKPKQIVADVLAGHDIDSVAFVGCINFIGLIASHIMRRFVGNDMRFLLPGSMLCGASLLIASDIACRTLASPAVLPIGALTSFLGAPLFLFLIIWKKIIEYFGSN